MADWDQRFLDAAQFFSSWSKDRSTKVGCVIVGPDKEIRSTGYNGFPRGLEDELGSRHERPAKYFYTSHAEANAICNASRIGVSTKGCTLYCTMFPCADCARAIIQAGITRVVILSTPEPNERWEKSFSYALEMLEECLVEVLMVEEERRVA